MCTPQETVSTIAPQQNMVAPTLLYDLNIDCLLEIFRMLSLGDLTTVTRVCRKFRDVAVDTFKYEWKDKTIRLRNDSRKRKLLSTAILRNFGSQLRTVEIVFDEHRNDKFFKLIIDKCGPQLKRVDFSSTSFNDELEIVLSKENITCFNEKFVNLTTLRFLNNISYITKKKCIEQHFPALEELSLSGYPFVNKNIRQFVSCNPQIKRFSSFHWNNVFDAVDMVETIDQHLPRLEKLGLWMLGLMDVTQFRPLFLKSLRHLKIHNHGNSANLQHLSISNECLEEMELELGSCDEIAIDFICQYKELTKLTIHAHSNRPLDYKCLSNLDKHLPKLAELKIFGYLSDLNNTDVVHFVHGLKRLASFTLLVWHLDILKDLNEIRQKLDSALWTVNGTESTDQLHFTRANRCGNK